MAMDRPQHGYDRNASHEHDSYMCTCGSDSEFGCTLKDQEWMDWAEDKLSAKKVSRLEIINKHGRVYVNTDLDTIRLSFQDDDRTLKIFVDTMEWI